MKVLLEGVVGSTAYGLATPESDIDILGVFAADTSDILSLDWSPKKETITRHHPDVTHHEFGKLIRLLLGGNPTVTELLYLESFTVRDEMVERLLQNRRSFLGSDKIKAAYGGYALEQAKRLVRRHGEGKAGFESDLAKRTAKHGRHCMRLIIQGKQLLRTGTITIDVGDQRDWLFSMGDLAETEPEAFLANAKLEIAAMENLSSSLPSMADRDKANDILLGIRQAMM